MKTKFFLIALISLFLFAACGKGDEPKLTPSSHSIAFTTEKAKEKKIKLKLNAALEDQQYIWIDLNGNNKKDDGEAVLVFDEDKEYTIDSPNIKVYGKITEFDCSENEISALELTEHSSLEVLECKVNKLNSLDVSKHSHLKTLSCSGNQLSSLDVSQNTELKELLCHNNELSSLDVSKNMELTTLFIYMNKIRGPGMDDLINSMPTYGPGMEDHINRMPTTKAAKGVFRVVDISNKNEKNKITTEQVKHLKDNKNWSVLDSEGRIFHSENFN